MNDLGRRCDCEHLNCELGSLRFPAHHKAGGCKQIAVTIYTSHGMKVALCTECIKRFEEKGA
jgi:hypothetical protein